MIKLALLLVITVGVIEARPGKWTKRQSNDTRVEVFPEFHLLNNGSTDEPSGLLLAAVGDDLGVMCVQHIFTNFDDICQAMGHGPAMAFDAGDRYFNSSHLLEFPAVINDIETAANTTHFYMDSNDTTCARIYIYLWCEGKTEPTPAPEPVKEVFFELLSVNSAGETTTEQSEGMVIAIVVTDEDWDNMEYGSVCDDSVNLQAAHVVCRSKGYTGASNYGNIDEYSYDFSENSTYNLNTIMDQFNCPEGADSVGDCSYDLYRHDCSFGENLVVFCESDNSTTDEWEVAYGALIIIDADGNNIGDGSEGLLYVALQNGRSGAHKEGTVCDDSFSNSSANVVCKALGFEYAISWQNHRNFQYVQEEMIEYYNVSIVMDEVRCPDSASDFDDCTYEHEHDCRHSEDVTLHCGGGDNTPEPPTWSPTSTSEPLDDEIAVKFGGLEVQMKVNPRKGRAKIADILEHIMFGY